MPRPKNSKNRPKFCGVKLSLLCQYLNPDVIIPVSAKFVEALTEGNKQITFETLSNETAEKMRAKTESAIEFTVIN